jgi:parallel beta-helix repeat protein
MKKTILPALILVCMMALSVVCVQFVKAQSLTGIIIGSDGSVSPSGSPIQVEGNNYVVTSGLYNSITIERGNVVVDGANHTLQGPGTSQNSTAITLMARNVTVENFNVTGWKAGVYGAFNNNTITNNVFSGNYQAIALYADDYVISENSISGSSDVAILVDTAALRSQGDNNLITQNQITNNNGALDILKSNGTTITENNIANNALILTLASLTAYGNDAGFQMLFLNNFVNNTQTLLIPFAGPIVVGVVPLSPAGQWDNGSVGNYWVDYLSRYPNATEIDHSGIGDTPYEIVDSGPYSISYANGTTVTGTLILGTAIDHYPLMTPFPIFASTNSKINASPSPSTSNSTSSTVPEFSTWVILPLFAVVILLSVLFIRKKLSEK